MRRISFTASLAIAATLALTGGTAAAKPKDPGLGDRVEIRLHKNAKLRTENGLKIAYVKFDYRCAPSPNLELISVDVSMTQPLPGGGATGGPGGGPNEPMRCTNRWHTATVTGEGTWWAGGPPFRKGQLDVSLIVIFADFTAEVERFGQASGTVVLR